MRIMGLDASTSCTGIAIYDTEINDFVYVDKIRTSKKKITPTDAMRRQAICAEISYLMLTEYVDVVVIEDIYVSQVSSAIPLAALRGAIEQATFNMECGDGLLAITSSQVKKVVTGKGNASKEDVYHKIKKIYKNSKLVRQALGKELKSKDNAEKNEDMSDACAVVYSYLTEPSLAYLA